MGHVSFTLYTGISKINSVYGNLKDLDMCVCEALSYMYDTMETVYVGVLLITTNIN